MWVERKDTKWVEGDKRFEGKGGVGVLHQQRGQIKQSRYKSWRSPRNKSQCCLQKKDTEGGQLQE